MKLRKIMISLTTALLALSSVSMPVSAEESTTTWTEVPIGEICGVRSNFYTNYRLRDRITETDYVFSGTVIDRKQYEVAWTDQNGDTEKQYKCAVIEVKVNKEYYGESPAEGDTLKIYVNEILDMPSDDSFMMIEGYEYIFLSKCLDEEYAAENSVNNPYDKSEKEKYADVRLGDLRSCVIPVIDDKVAVFDKLLKWNSDITSEVISADSIPEEIMPPYSYFGKTLSLNLSDFEEVLEYMFSFETTPLCDADSDGVVNSSDASAVLKLYIESSTSGKSIDFGQILSFDANFDNIVDATDASDILGFYAYAATGGEWTFTEYLEDKYIGKFM